MSRTSDSDRSRDERLPKQPAELDPFEINFLPEFQQGRGPREVFVNEHGVVIGDHEYESPESPLNQWSTETDPEIMSGDQWVHPYKDIGFYTEENRDYFEKGISPQAGIFMHPSIDVAYEANRDEKGQLEEAEGSRDEDERRDRDD